MKINLTVFNPVQTMNRIFNQKVGIFTAETWGRYFSPYVPMQTGMLDQNRETEPFRVIYTSIYSKTQHNGDNFNFSKEQHPLACAHWEKSSYTANSEKVSKEITEYIKKI